MLDLQKLVTDQKATVTQSNCEAISEKLYNLTKGEGISLTAFRENLQNGAQAVLDAYFNPKSGIGTFKDAISNIIATTPVSLSPREATAYYANGGVPKIIIDKKAGLVFLEKMPVVSKYLEESEIEAIETRLQELDFWGVARRALRDALIYGGSVLWFKKQHGKIKKIVTTDRWNVVFDSTVLIPTAENYLTPKTVFFTQTGEEAKAEDCIFLRPHPLPYWAAIKNLGWGASDFTGWIKDYEAYEIMKTSLPIMAQQLSLLVHKYPLSDMLLTNGVQQVEEFQRFNEDSMAGWSMLQPKMVNNIGDLEVLNRSYSDYQHLIQEARLAVSAGAEIPLSVLFPENPSGLASDRQQDVELKQAEMARRLYNNIEKDINRALHFVLNDCFGENSRQAKFARDIEFEYITATPEPPKDKAERFSMLINSAVALISAGVEIEEALQVVGDNNPDIDFNAILQMDEL